MEISTRRKYRAKFFVILVDDMNIFLVSNIIVDNLEEKEAYDAEVWYIYECKYIFGYDLVNLDEGGRGALGGTDNPMYGRKGKLNPN